MAQSKLQKKLFHMVYSLGASIVILGALGKIMHMSILGIPGGTLLTIGLVVEAIVFAISAFEPMEEDLDWSKVYPELTGGQRNVVQGEDTEAKSLLSEKLDNMLKEAKLDVGLMKSLTGSIENFKGAAENIKPAVDSIAATNRYSEQLSLAASQMESLNSLYKVQLESTNRQAQANEEIANNATLLKDHMKQMSDQLSLGTTHMESLNDLYKKQAESTSHQAQVNEEIAVNATQLKAQMESMAANLENLNSVYGGMLTAMTRK